MLNVSERRVVFLVGAVQFVNVLDFTMVTPLGPDFASALHIATSDIGKIIAGYGPAAALAGLLGSFFLDRFDRRPALVLSMLGLVLGTLAGGLARSLEGLVLARVIAGAFGGPATSLGYAIIADVIPPERRGKAMGAVLGAFSVAQVVGVAAAVAVSQRWGWRVPFIAVAVLGFVVTAGVAALLPPLRGHLATPGTPREQPISIRELLSRRTVWISYGMTATLMASGFVLIPNVPAYILANLHYPRDHFQYLIAAGGVVSFVTLRLVGRLVDRAGSLRVVAVAVPLSLLVAWCYFIRTARLPVMLLYCAFMITLGARNVAYNALTSKVPRPRERARFLSLQSSVYHASAGLAAWAGTHLLRQRPDGTLEGIARVAWISMALGATLPLWIAVVEARVRREGGDARATSSS